MLDHFQNPRNAGEIENPDSSAQLENPACGDVMRLTLRVVDDRVSEIRFRAKGCVPSIACGSAITELAKGKTVPEIVSIKREDLIGMVGGLPEASSHAAQLAFDVLRQAIQRLPSRDRLA
jgi:nitrogen fixation NifU-like protein